MHHIKHGRMRRNPLLQLKIDLQRWLLRTESLQRRIVSTYAYPLAILNDSFDSSYVVNDFFYYCFTKSTRTLAAINLLLEGGLGEDAQILVRTSYESYLAIAFLDAHPERLDDLVAKKIGLKTGHFQHPKNPSGRVDYRRIVETETGDVLPFSLSVAEMAGLTRYPDDAQVHRRLYMFLSEHCHAHMMASGNYRNGANTKYVADSGSQVLQACFHTVYVYTLILSELIKFQGLGSRDRARTRSVVRAGYDLLNRALKDLVFADDLEALLLALKARIRHGAHDFGDV